MAKTEEIVVNQATGWKVKAFLGNGELAFENTYDTLREAIYAQGYYQSHGFNATIE